MFNMILLEAVVMETKPSNSLNKIMLTILLTDIVLSSIDGFELLEKIKTLQNKPKIIVLSNLTHEGFISKAIEEGASYFMIKPFDNSTLLKRIEEVLSVKKDANIKAVKNKPLEEKITNIFITVGIPAHIKGYQYLREAIKMAIENPDIINSITKKLYPAIAENLKQVQARLKEQ